MSHGHSLSRRRAVLALAAGALLPARGMAQEAYPARAISLVSGYAAGGPVDTFGRIAANQLSALLKVPVVLETKAGASGLIAGGYVAEAPPDGYRLLVTVPSLFTMLPSMMDNVRVRERDFVPVGQLAEAPMVLVCNPAVAAADAKAFLALLKKDKTLSFASAGTGTLPHLTAELLLSRIGATALHVPYKGSALALQDVIGGQVQFATDNVAPALPLIKAGRLRALAVTSSTRFAGLPDVPTLAESGVDGFSATNWFGIFAPAQTPANVIATLSGALGRIVASTEYQELVAAQGATVVRQGPDETRRRVAAESEQWGGLIRKLGIKA